MNRLFLFLLTFSGLTSGAAELQTPVNFDVARHVKFLTLAREYNVPLDREYSEAGYSDGTLTIPKGAVVKVIGNFRKKTGLNNVGVFSSCKIELQYENSKFYLSSLNLVAPMAVTKEELDYIVKAVPCGNLPSEFGVYNYSAK